MFLQRWFQEGQYGLVIAVIVAIITIAMLTFLWARKRYVRRKVAQCRQDTLDAQTWLGVEASVTFPTEK